MSRQRALPAMSWLSRWLLVAATLAGLGVWQGGHCADDMPTAPGVQPTSVSGTLVNQAAARSTVTIPHRHADEPSPSSHDEPGMTADTCRDLPAAMSSTAVAGALLKPAGVRTAVVSPRIPPVKYRLHSGVALTDIGISRT